MLGRSAGLPFCFFEAPVSVAAVMAEAQKCRAVESRGGGVVGRPARHARGAGVVAGRWLAAAATARSSKK